MDDEALIADQADGHRRRMANLRRSFLEGTLDVAIRERLKDLAPAASSPSDPVIGQPGGVDSPGSGRDGTEPSGQGK